MNTLYIFSCVFFLSETDPDVKKKSLHDWNDLCERSLTLFDDLLRKAKKPEAQVHYLKIKGDFYKTLGQAVEQMGTDGNLR